jgi:protein-tyrosine phosphatase
MTSKQSWRWAQAILQQRLQVFDPSVLQPQWVNGLCADCATQPCEVLLIDILDMEDELLLPHFKDCIEFLRKHLVQEDAPAAVLVHCVYGQSRSAAICVAFLMATQGLTLLDAYNVVQSARPCISINPGFLRQLELFERMGSVPEIMGHTIAHAELRTMVAKQQRMKTGVSDIVATPQLSRPGKSLSCRKCNYVLCTTRNQVRGVWTSSSCILHVS